MLTLNSLADVQRLVENGIEGSLSLEYKSSDALALTDGKKREISKDISAMANSAGGQILYGIIEKNRKPTWDDPGVDPTRFSKETLEQIIDSNVRPRIDGLLISPVSLSSGRVVYIATVPQALARAPHQASDRRYYIRQNFQVVPMEDFQIRDAFRRATSPDLFVSFAFDLLGSKQFEPDTATCTGMKIVFRSSSMQQFTIAHPSRLTTPSSISILIST